MHPFYANLVSMDSSCCADHSSLFLCASDTYSGRYEHLSLALSREIDRKLMGKWDSCKRYCLALFNYLKCIPSMQSWYRWIALVLLIIPSLFSCPSVTYSGRYEHFSLALRREIDRRLVGKWDSCKLYLLALFNYLKCFILGRTRALHRRNFCARHFWAAPVMSHFQLRPRKVWEGNNGH